MELKNFLVKMFESQTKQQKYLTTFVYVSKSLLEKIESFLNRTCNESEEKKGKNLKTMFLLPQKNPKILLV